MGKRILLCTLTLSLRRRWTRDQRCQALYCWWVVIVVIVVAVVGNCCRLHICVNDATVLTKAAHTNATNAF